MPGEYEGVDRMPPADVASLVADAIRRGRFWILTHPAFGDAIERRARGIVATNELVAGYV